MRSLWFWQAIAGTHTFYRDSWFETIPKDCITLCDRCHNIEHGFEFRQQSEVDSSFIRMLEKYECFIATGRRVAFRFRKQLKDGLPMCPPDIQKRVMLCLLETNKIWTSIGI